MSTPTTNPVAWHEASSYAAAVRAHLDDLAPEVVEELAGGLEADLLDQAEESTDPLGARLGDPAAYAAELRAAAGVPPRTSVPGSRTSFRQEVEGALDAVRAQPWWPQAARVGRELRPAWWVVRGWVAFQLLDAVFGGTNSAVFPRSLPSFLALVLLVGGSFALGRGLFATWRPTRFLVVAGNVLAALLLLPVAAWANGTGDPAYQGVAAAEAPWTAPGLVADGRTVTNVFPYGPDGEPLSGVTLLDQDGEPITVASDALPGEPVGDGDRLRVQVPNWTADGDVAWNVFPMGTAVVDADDFYAEYYEGDGTAGSGLRPPYRSFDEGELPRVRVPQVLVDPSRSLSSQPRPSASVPTAPAPTAPAPTTTETAPTAPAPTP